MNIGSRFKELTGIEATVVLYVFSEDEDKFVSLVTFLFHNKELQEDYIKKLDKGISGWLKGHLAKFEKDNLFIELDVAEKVMGEFMENELAGIVKDIEEKNIEAKNACLEYRKLIRSDVGDIEGSIPDQMLGVPMPDFVKPYPEGSVLIKLPEPKKEILTNPNLFDCIIERASRRKFTPDPISLDELSMLCFTTQGMRKKQATGRWHFRNVPSGGARHPYETYLAIINVEGLEPGIYRYIPIGNQLLFMFAVEQAELREKMTYYSEGQKFAGESAVVFIWSCIPYRTEWRYSSMARRDLLLESGHICQNLYLCVEGLGLGTCSILAYRQDLDDYLGLDGVNELVTYISPVGRLSKD